MTAVLSNPPAARPDLDKGLGKAGLLGFGAAVLGAILYVLYALFSRIF
jgi:PiT family inorganic phosphate transporter